MHIQAVTYSLDRLSEEQWITDANQAAAGVAASPGLQAAIWLENPEENRYGTVYIWEDREAMESGRIWVHPDASDVSIEDYGVLERLTKATQPALTLL